MTSEPMTHRLLARRFSGLALAALLMAGPAMGCAAVPVSKFPLSTPTSSPTEPAQPYSFGADWLSQRYGEIDADLNDKVDLPKVRLVFVGDSITQFWRGWSGLNEQPLWLETFGRPETENYGLNLGVAGDRTENVLLRLLAKKDGGFGQLDDARINPEIIVLMLGINNVSRTEEPVVDKVVAGDLAVIKRLRALRPNAHILVQSVLPTNNPGDLERYIKPINSRLAAEAPNLGANISWLDLYPSFVGADGEENPVMFRDGYHLTLQGYQVWRARLLPALDEIRSRSAKR